MSDHLQPVRVVNRELKKFRCLPHKGPIGGVCAGLGYRLGVAPWAIRLGLTLSVLLWGVGLGIYLLLWIFVPNADITPRDYAARTGDES
jgi:phage shock protein C